MPEAELNRSWRWHIVGVQLAIDSFASIMAINQRGLFMRILLAGLAGLLISAAIPVMAQPFSSDRYGINYRSDDIREIQREYRRDLAEARRKCAEELRDADDRREYREEQRKCREEIAEVERDYREELRDARRDWREDRRDRRFDYDD